MVCAGRGDRFAVAFRTTFEMRDGKRWARKTRGRMRLPWLSRGCPEVSNAKDRGELVQPSADARMIPVAIFFARCAGSDPDAAKCPPDQILRCSTSAE